MRVTSSHTSGDFAAGRIDISLAGTSPAGEALAAQFFFRVPTDFRAHNDLVAASLMTILGYAHSVVEFNFPISRRCADLLAHHYGLFQIGPVDESLEPRGPGRNLGLSFSSGLDSLGLHHFLHRTIPDQLKVVFVDFGGQLRREKDALHIEPDVCCATNFRTAAVERNGGRFIGAVIVLYADYLDLDRITFGDTYDFSKPGRRAPSGNSVDSQLVERAMPFRAAALEEVYLLHSVLFVAATMLSVVGAASDGEVERALRASAPPDSEKGVRKRLALRYLYASRELPVPSFVASLSLPAAPARSRFGRNLPQDFEWVFLSKHFGTALASRVVAGIDRFDLSEVHQLSLAFYAKYNTSVAELIPASMRNAALAWFHDCGVYPYTEQDWHELDTVRRFLRQLHTAPEAIQLPFGGRPGKPPPHRNRQVEATGRNPAMRDGPNGLPVDDGGAIR